MDRKIFVIGIGSMARVGKDTLAKCLFELFDQAGYDGRIYSLANALKQDCEQFLREKCDMDVWTGNTEEKAKFRDLLVAYGKIQRIRSGGTYWTSLVKNKINSDASKIVHTDDNTKPFIAIIPDIRYAVFDKDEVDFIQNQLGGKLIHLMRLDENGNKLVAPNEDEKTNDPKIEALADYHLVWDTFGDYNANNFANSPLYTKVYPLFEKLKRDSELV